MNGQSDKIRMLRGKIVDELAAIAAAKMQDEGLVLSPDEIEGLSQQFKEPISRWVRP
jgi:hypothetical protein